MSLFFYLSQTGDMPGSKISNAPITHFSRFVHLPLLDLIIDSQEWKPYYKRANNCVCEKISFLFS